MKKKGSSNKQSDSNRDRNKSPAEDFDWESAPPIEKFEQFKQEMAGQRNLSFIGRLMSRYGNSLFDGIVRMLGFMSKRKWGRPPLRVILRIFAAISFRLSGDKPGKDAYTVLCNWTKLGLKNGVAAGNLLEEGENYVIYRTPVKCPSGLTPADSGDACEAMSVIDYKLINRFGGRLTILANQTQAGVKRCIFRISVDP